MDLITDGFIIIRDYFSYVELRKFEEAIMALYAMQAAKIGIQSEFCQLYEKLESSDKEALYQVQHMMPSCPALRIDRLAEFSIHAPILISGPALFVNRPNTERLLYKWHSEEHYYPKRRNFLNAWFPLFGDKTKDNGTMSFKVGSHVRHYPFCEYQGYNRDTLGKENHFIQYEIPENFVADFEEFHVEANRGDLVLFHSNLVHRSNINKSAKYSFAGVARIWSPKEDLTLSGNFSVTPYGKDIGRPGMLVNAV